MRLSRFVVLLVGVALGATIFAAESSAAEFRIGKDGRRILLPLTLNDREILCLVDTGASSSAFDSRLKSLLGEFRGYRLIQTPAGRSFVPTFDWPDTRLGGQILKTDRPVVCVDFAEARSAAGENILAIIGMDVLKSRRLQIDFDGGILRLLDSFPKNRDELGDAVPIVFAPDDTPSLVGSFRNGRKERFLIDTGAQGNSIAADAFDELVERKLIRPGGSSMSVTVTGAVAGEAGRLDSLSLGRFTHHDLRVARINVSSLGLRYLSRFRVTLDFPGRTAYLLEGDHFARPEPLATSGLSLAWVDSHVVVQTVMQDGPGEKAGIRPNDILSRVNGTDASEYDHYSLRELLTSEVGKKIPLTIRRNMREIDVLIVLAEK